MAHGRTLAIVGGGFSGSVLACALLTRSAHRYQRLLLIDRGVPGRGLAYAEQAYPLLLNVPAGRMSAEPHQPLDFVHFAQRRLSGAQAHDFLPRALYGDYLQQKLATAARAALPALRLEHVRGEAVALARASPSGWQLLLTDGRRIVTHELVLALGNPPPMRLPALEPLEGSSCYVADPWSAPLGFGVEECVLVIGTGLTMADIVTAGMAGAGGRARVHALSRHGLLPPPQTAFTQASVPSMGRRALLEGKPTVRRLVQCVRALAAEHASQGGDWREVIALVRQQAPRLWQGLPPCERRRFLRHARTYWDIHRHRLPEQTHAQLKRLTACGQLQLHAGRLLASGIEGSRVRVRWRPRGAHRDLELRADRIINCTGPDYDVRRSHDPLVRMLLAQGLISADPLGLGMRTGTHGALLDREGRAVPGLYYLGPMLRAAHWECTAAAELRSHAEELAQHLSAPWLERALA